MFTDITGEAIFARDRFYLTDDLVSTRQLRLKEPLVFDSELTYWNGIYLPPENYRIVQNTLFLNDDVPLQDGDVIYVQYAILGD